MLLEQLSNAFGVSSVEGDVRKIILQAGRDYADSWRVDTMGNLFLTRKRRIDGPGSPRRVMVTAHMDEVGFIITKVQDGGLLKFKPIGGFDPRVLPGKSLLVGKDRALGIIGVKPTHMLKRSDRSRVDEISTMAIDIGGSGSVKTGDFATFATKFEFLSASDDTTNLEQGLVKGKAFDNRAGCAMLLELLKGDYPIDLEAVFTVQEEVGLRGARVAAYAVDPDLAFVLECTAADDLPRLDEKADEGIPRLGSGPAVTVMDRSFIADRRLVDLLIDVAKRQQMPYQFKRPGIGGTDAGAVHLTREGVPSAVVSVPARYIHAPAAVLDLSDFWHTVALLQATLGELQHFDLG